jgi:hypothetical protein
VIEVKNDHAASIGGVALTELSLEEAERLVRVLDDLGMAWLYRPEGGLPP